MTIGATRRAHRSSPRRGAFFMALGWLVLVWSFGQGIAAVAAEAETAGPYQGPTALAASRDGRPLYVACAASGQVAWIDVAGGRVTRRIAVPASPTGLALSPDGRKLIVACAAPASAIVVLDAVSGRRIAAIRTGHTSMGPALSPDGRRLYVCNRFDNDVSVIDLEAGRELARVRAEREPVAAAVTPDGRTLLVANHLPNTRTDPAFKGDVSPVVTVVDTRTHATAAIPLTHGSNGLHGVCVSPDGRHAFVTHLLSNFEMVPFRVDGGWINVNVLSVIDLRQRKVVRTVGMDDYDAAAGNPWDVVCTPDGRTVCVSLAGTHELCLIETSEILHESAKIMTPMMGVWPIYPSLGGGYWRRIALPGKGPRGLAVAGSDIFAAQYFSDTVVVVDPKAPGGAATEIPLGPAPVLTRQRRGELLFHDATICQEHWQSCASCHPDGRVDGLNWDLLNDGEGNSKNTKSMLLAHRTAPAMWEGVRMSAEEAVRSGLAHILFAQRPEDEAADIDVYLKSLRPVPSPRLVDGRPSPAAERGRAIFHSERVGCDRCHPAPLYTDRREHNVGTRGPRSRRDRFDTPTLLEVWRTAPYLHDGRYATIEDLLVEGRHGLPRDGELSPQDIDDLVEFVLSL